MTSKSWPWFVPDTDKDTIRILVSELGIHRLTASALYQRGLHTPQDAQRFLSCDLSDLGDPFLMTGAGIAAERLAAAVAKREMVLIFGDYDVDGLTSTALMTRALQELDVPVEYYIPSRFADGYGLQSSVLEEFAECGGKLVVTVDCGINSFSEMQKANELGLDLIVTDHHTCFEGTRAAFAVLNPKQAGCSYPEKQLAGVGVAWTLVRALYARLGMGPAQAHRYLDLVAVGTVADVVPLLGENRILVKQGLLRLQEHPLPGLKALAQVSGLPDTRLTARKVAFTMAPRLNAAGRMGEADPAMHTLLADAETADTYAAELDELNRQRQHIEKDILKAAELLAEQQAAEPALVLWQEGWNPGVIGIVAGRLASVYKRPVALIAFDTDEGRGSIRSPEGFNVVSALQDCSAYLERFGGHPEAAGFTVSKTMLPRFREAFCRSIAVQKPKEKLQPVVARVHLGELNLDLANELEMLAPFGQGHPEPLFWVNEAEVVTARRVGAQKDHLRLSLRHESPSVAAICFGGGDEDISPEDMVELIAVAGVNEWRGKTSLSLQIKDFRPLTADKPVVTDRRNMGQREPYIQRLAAAKKLAVWVNTKSAKEGLSAVFPGHVHVTQLGRGFNNKEEFDALLLYHIPYERSAFERLLEIIRFRNQKHLILCFGEEEMALNEKIFAATVPAGETLLQIADELQPQQAVSLSLAQIRQKVKIPVTHYLVEQVQTVFEELAAGSTAPWPPDEHQLYHSATFCKHTQALKQFHAYQQFWSRTKTDELIYYLMNPEGLNLEEEEIRPYDTASAEKAN